HEPAWLEAAALRSTDNCADDVGLASPPGTQLHSDMLKTTQDAPVRPPAKRWRLRAAVATLWIQRQSERLVLLCRAVRPSEEGARKIIWASLCSRYLKHLLTDDDEARQSHEIDTTIYQDWIRRFDSLSRDDKKTIL